MTDNIGEDALHDACGVFGCVTSKKSKQSVFEIIYNGLIALQHRGQESSGIVVSDDTKFSTKKGMGLVSNVFDDSCIGTLKGSIGIGHNRYSTHGTPSLLHCQPFVVHTSHGKIAIAHNGELVNAKRIRTKLLKNGIGLSTESDSELISQLLANEPACGELHGVNWVSRIRNFMEIVPCSFSVVFMTSSMQIYAFRDPFGNRPLCLGEIHYENKSNAGILPQFLKSVFIVSSESCAFSSIGANYIREVEPGEIVELTENGVRSCCIVEREMNKAPALCIFEYVYFARADSKLEDQYVYNARKECGRQLSIEGNVDADIVSTIPDSATPSAKGFAEQSGIPYEEVLVKNQYIGRTFIQPEMIRRKKAILKKFAPLPVNIKGKRIVLVDDSIVRGTTMPCIIELLKNAGAKEVHIRIASPPLKHTCPMGINIPTRQELVANKYNIAELASVFGADSLVYLSIEGLEKAISKEIKKKVYGHCTACLTGNYPVELDW